MKRYLTLLLLVLALNVWAQSYPGTNNSLPEGAGEPPNDPPVWNTTPAPTFTEGVVASYDLSQHFSDPEADPLDIVNETGCTLPTGMAIDDPNDELDEDGTSPAATTNSCVFSIDDGTNAPVNSSAFSITVNAIPALGSVYERDMFGVPRTGTSGATEPVAAGGHTGNPVAELNWLVDIEDSDYACDATVATGDADWTTKVNNDANDVVCIDPGDHSSKGTLEITDGGAAGTTRTISAITLNNPVRVDFTAAHGWTTGDIIHCDDGAGGTWQMRWRFFKVTVVDTDTVDLDGQDGTGNGTRPAWTTYTSGGTCQAPTFKVIRHSSNLSAHPATLASGSRAKAIRLYCGTSSASIEYLIVIGLSIDHKGTAASIGATGNRIYACDYVIFDQLHDYNDEAIGDIEGDFKQRGFLARSAGADDAVNFVQIQRSFFDERGTDGLGTDNHWFAMTTTTSKAVRLIQNEHSSVISAWQIVSGSSSNHEGFTMAESSDWLHTGQYTDCAGNIAGGTTFGASASSPCAVAESAGAFKTTFGTEGRINVDATNRHRLIVIDANIQCCRRSEDGVISDGGSGGQSFGFSTGGGGAMRNVLWRNNVVFANERGIPQGYANNDGKTIEYISTVGNINYDMNYEQGAGQAVILSWFAQPNDTNQFFEVAFNTMVSAPHWANVRRIANTTFECNLLIDVGDRQNTPEGTWVQKNNYGYGTTVELDGTGDTDGGATANANMADLTINPKLWSDSAFTFTLPKVLSTATSPHAGDCPSIGVVGQGVSDSTVTF